MGSEIIEEQISAYLDGELDVDARALVDAELARSVELRAVRDRLHAVRDAVAGLPRVTPPAALAEKISTAVREAPPPVRSPAPPRSRAWKKQWFSFASAAALLVIVGLVTLVIHDEPGLPSATERPANGSSSYKADSAGRGAEPAMKEQKHAPRAKSEAVPQSVRKKRATAQKRIQGKSSATASAKSSALLAPSARPPARDVQRARRETANVSEFAGIVLQETVVSGESQRGGRFDGLALKDIPAWQSAEAERRLAEAMKELEFELDQWEKLRAKAETQREQVDRFETKDYEETKQAGAVSAGKQEKREVRVVFTFKEPLILEVANVAAAQQALQRLVQGHGGRARALPVVRALLARKSAKSKSLAAGAIAERGRQDAVQSAAAQASSGPSDDASHQFEVLIPVDQFHTFREQARALTKPSEALQKQRGRRRAQFSETQAPTKSLETGKAQSRELWRDTPLVKLIITLRTPAETSRPAERK